MTDTLASTHTVCRRIGVSYRELDYWIRCGAVRPHRVADGSGSRRGFTRGEVAALTHMTAVRSAASDVGMILTVAAIEACVSAAVDGRPCPLSGFAGRLGAEGADRPAQAATGRHRG